MSAPLQRVLVAVDLSSISDRVLQRAARLPLAANAQVTVFHVVPDDLPQRAKEQAMRDARTLLREEAASLRSAVPRGVHVDANAQLGSGAKDIAQLAKSLRAELIVMGRGGGRALRDAFLGSTAERVIRLGRTPVLTVRLAARAAYSKPALALELDKHAPHVITWARRIVGPLSSRITVIHAVDTPYRGVAYPSLTPGKNDSYNAELELKASRKIAKVFDSALPPAAALRWKPHVRAGSARLVIGKAVRRADNDLLVLGTHGHTGLAYVVLGTVAGDVLREVACDVLVVPPLTSAKRATRPR
jgi:nucleotide-binding universal stress UspA family protein